MPAPDAAKLVIAAALTAVLAWASWRDVKSRTIPNRAVLAVLALFAAWIAVGRGAGLVPDLEAAAIAFALTFVLYLFRVIGAGDVKLFAALALFAGFTYLPLFALMTVLAGGCIAAVSLASSPRRALALFHLGGKGGFGRGVPYGAAIAIGGLAAVWGELTGVAARYAFTGLGG